MIFTGLNNETYTTGRELGKGGEGSVYELQSQRDLVLKQYNEPLTPAKQNKLLHMVAMRSPIIEAYAAWPIDVVKDDKGETAGFVMKKLQGYVPLHHVFSPMDRKKMFHDKGYNFLVHVARNIATAFHKLHEAGLVVGDVNEGNILISASGLAAFIDCDSFQVRHNDDYYFCEVGVPRYTPPELLKKSTFENVIRTVNTDDFSLAVLIFQLLFLGRHPFAGRHKGAADIDEETAIRQRQFAYSLENTKKKLQPPPDSFNISDLPQGLVGLFHRAFEHDERPTPSEWIMELDGLLKNMVTCSVSALHTYPAGMQECPWCWFRKNKGIMYFLDDSYFQANTVLGNIEQFINGFRPEPIVLKKLNIENNAAGITPNPVPASITGAAKKRSWVFLLLVIIAICFFPFYPAISAVFVFTAVYVSRWSGWVKQLQEEMKTRTNAVVALRSKLQLLVREYESPQDLPAYNKGMDNLQRLIHDFRRLPDELERRKKAMEEVLYNEQLDEYLRAFDIEDHTIPSIGPAKKRALYNSGIRHAAHLSRLATTKVPGIGPAFEQVLMSWRRQMSAGFVYIPDTYRINEGMQKVSEEVAKIRLQLESNIRREYQSLNFLKVNIRNRSELIEVQVKNLAIKVWQAELDIAAFRKYAPSRRLGFN